MSISIKKQKTTKIVHMITLSGKSIVQLLQQSGMTVPDNAEVTFAVPRGGDYSGMNVEFNHEELVDVTFTTIETEEETEDDFTMGEYNKVLEAVKDNYGISEACREFLGWSKKEANDADGTNWDDVVEAILTNPNLIETKRQMLQ